MNQKSQVYAKNNDAACMQETHCGPTSKGPTLACVRLVAESLHEKYSSTVECPNAPQPITKFELIQADMEILEAHLKERLDEEDEEKRKGEGEREEEEKGEEEEGEDEDEDKDEEEEGEGEEEEGEEEEGEEEKEGEEEEEEEGEVEGEGEEEEAEEEDSSRAKICKGCPLQRWARGIRWCQHHQQWMRG